MRPKRGDFVHRFFVNNDAIKGDMVEITAKDFNHISHALRLQPGDIIIVNNGDGLDYTVSLNKFSKSAIIGEIIKKEINKNEAEVNITLAQAIPKNRNMELVIQKCTEIGVKDIIPLQTERTIVQLSGKKKDKRLKRWQRIAREAAKQSERGIIPEVRDIHSIAKIKSIKDDYDLVLVCWTGEKESNLKKIISELAVKPENILITVGPEGGFTSQEVAQIAGKTITMGPRILRTETAGLVALTMVMYELGEMGGK